MNLSKIAFWVLGIVICAAAIGQLSQLQQCIWKAQAKVIYESRTSTWGSPRFFPEKLKRASKDKLKPDVHFLLT